MQVVLEDVWPGGRCATRISEGVQKAREREKGIDYSGKEVGQAVSRRRGAGIKQSKAGSS
jgi:hypothetical protein